ncbi:HlyD family efflux transporter periplasmic adaptor subunit [Rhodopirellula europaea]|uniref:HlyD family efflux transporter periplasmic adaptor subunit n=1 Tax=Rhodopirellula europaea TaxID=1263866 RepID=UPI003D2E694F|tara:strand:+ start:80079 stop:82289 length:2211 start_codon:yes stop_codon:yes gene_type:complete
MSSAAIQPRLRPDLICRIIRIGKSFQWVIRDPVVSTRGSHDRFSAQWMVNEQEFAILQSLDGRRSFDQAHLHCQRLLAPVELSREDFAAFVDQANRNAWVTTASAHGTPLLSQNEAGTQRHELGESFWRRVLHNPLAIRIPLVDPDRWLDRPVQIARNFVARNQRTCTVIGSAWTVLAGAILLTHWERLIPAIGQSASALQSPSTWIVLAFVISGVKLIHELAHAIACKWFGGSCHEMGVMLLFGIPCLYCDVSDAWLIPQPWKRMLVSAAGILAECVLGSLALVAWTHSMPGLPQNVLLFVLMVTSVNTMILNGNPLMRYDGYYLLSDAVSIPNLATRSRVALQMRLRSWFWGASSIQTESQSQPTAVQNDRNSLGLLAYATASSAYRLVVFGTIGWLLLNHLASIGATTIGIAAIAILLYRVMRVWTAPILRTPSEVAPVKARRRSRLMIGLVAALSVAVLSIPLPHRVNATAKVQPIQQTKIFALTAGRLESIASTGRFVRANESIARLSDWKTFLQIERLEGEIAELEARLKGTRMSRIQSDAGTPTLANIPTIEFALQSKREELLTIQKESEHLEIRSPHAGRVVAVSAKPVTPRQRSRSQIGWSGQPTEAINRGAWINSGSPICNVVSDDQHKVSVSIDASQIAWVREGQAAVTTFPSGTAWNGYVSEVGTRPSENDGTYEITVALDPDKRPFDFPPPSNWTAKVSVHVEPASLWKRTRHWLATHFRTNS